MVFQVHTQAKVYQYLYLKYVKFILCTICPNETKTISLNVRTKQTKKIDNCYKTSEVIIFKNNIYCSRLGQLKKQMQLYLNNSIL
jgi:hypothetical protein